MHGLEAVLGFTNLNAPLPTRFFITSFAFVKVCSGLLARTLRVMLLSRFMFGFLDVGHLVYRLFDLMVYISHAASPWSIDLSHDISADSRKVFLFTALRGQMVRLHLGI